jgi:hypothetical protein
LKLSVFSIVQWILKLIFKVVVVLRKPQVAVLKKWQYNFNMIKLTIDNPGLERRLKEQSELNGQTPDQLVKEYVEQGLSHEDIRIKLKKWREKLQPYGKEAGLDTDEKIFDAIS